MNAGGDAAEQVVRLSLEGLEAAVRITGSAARNIAEMLAAALKSGDKTRGRERLTKMIRSGKALKVFPIPQKDLREFTRHAREYGVLYTVLRSRTNTDGKADIIARAEDAAKIQRIYDRFLSGCAEKTEAGAREDPLRAGPLSGPRFTGEETPRRESVREKLRMYAEQRERARAEEAERARARAAALRMTEREEAKK